MEEKLQAHQVEIDPDFEPQSRPRSCTWPLPHPDFAAEEEDGGAAGGPPALAAGGGEGAENAAAPAERRTAAAASLPPPGADVGQLRKAKTSRRNAWGNLSYADLITKAIESSPEKRLTLSQIYDWMVRYVPYFKDKGDSNSSAGWKVPEPPPPTPTRTPAQLPPVPVPPLPKVQRSLSAFPGAAGACPWLVGVWGIPAFLMAGADKGSVKFWGEPVPRGVVCWNQAELVPGSPTGLGLSRSTGPPSSPGRSGRGGWQRAGWSRQALLLVCEHRVMVSGNPAATALPVPARGHPSPARSPSASGVPRRTAGGRAVPKQVSPGRLLPSASLLSQPPPSPGPCPPPGGPRRQHTAPTAPRWLSLALLPGWHRGLVSGAGSNPPLAQCELGMYRTDHSGTGRGHGACRVLGRVMLAPPVDACPAPRWEGGRDRLCPDGVSKKETVSLKPSPKPCHLQCD